MKTIYEPEPGYVLVELDTGKVPGLETIQETYQSGLIIKINGEPLNLLGKIGHWAKYKDEVHLKRPYGSTLSFIKIADILGISYKED